MKPLISVIVSTKNEEECIEACLKSIKNQTYPNIEIIVSDARSTDDTVKIARKYADKVLVKKTNVSEGRNLGAKHARGKFLVFLDADVNLDKYFIINALKRLRSKNVAIVVGLYSFFEKNLRATIFEWYNKITVLPLFKIGVPQTLVGCTFAVKKSNFFKINGFREDLINAEDFDITLRMKKIGDVVLEKRCRFKTSARRFENEGYFKLILIWSINYAWFYFIRSSLVKSYICIR